MNSFLQTAEFWADEWTAALWRASWQGAIAIAVAWAIARRCRFLSPRVACWLWRLACLKMLVALVWAHPLSLEVLPAAAAKLALPSVTAPVVAPESPLIQEPGLPLAPVVAEQSRVTFRRVIFALWLAGVMYGMGGIARQWNSMRQLLSSASIASSDLLNAVCRQEADRLGVRPPPRLCLSSYVESPLLTGVWRPTIVLPSSIQEEFDAPEMRLMLAHELAHHSRRDLLWNWLPAIVRMLFFFHPLVWLQMRCWSEAQEAACDERLIQRGLVQPAEYGRLLLKLTCRKSSGWHPLPAAACVLGAYHNLERRILTMTRVRPHSSRRLALAATLCSLIAALTLVPWRLVAQEPAEAPVADGHLNVGNLLEVRMTGELAERYARCIGMLQDNKAPRGLEIETSAMVAQKLKDGRIRLEHSSPIRRGENKDRLLTMTAIVDPTKVKTDITPKGTSVYPSPDAATNGTKPTTTTLEAKTLRLQLSDLKGVKLRTWTLAEEIGD